MIHEVLPVRTVLTRSVSPRSPFAWSINPYRGCAFACRYCYARYTHQWLGLDPGADFDRRILLKRDVAELLEADLRRMRRAGHLGEPIAIGTATDPYQGAEHRYGLTRACLEVLRREEGHRLSITTKSDLILRDVELLRGVARGNSLRLHVTLITLDRELQRVLEPGAPSPRVRLATMAALARAHLAVDAFVLPIIPGLTDGAAELDRLFAALAGAGVRSVVCEALFLRSPTRESFFAFLDAERPEWAEDLRRRYGEGTHAAPLYVARLRARVERLRERWGLLGPQHAAPPAGGRRVRPLVAPRRTKRRPPSSSPPRSGRPRQLELF